MFSENFKVLDVENASVLLDFETDRVLFRKLNLTKKDKCSANKIYRNVLGAPVAVLCNCGKKHKVIGDLVFWFTELNENSIKQLKMESLDIKKAFWLQED
jgi:hypothetical protein